MWRVFFCMPVKPCLSPKLPTIRYRPLSIAVSSISTNSPPNQEKEMVLAGLYSEKTICLCDQACPLMDTSGKEELGKAQNNMEKIDWGWSTTNWTKLETTGKSCQGQEKMRSLVDALCSNGNSRVQVKSVRTMCQNLLCTSSFVRILAPCRRVAMF